MWFKGKKFCSGKDTVCVVFYKLSMEKNSTVLRTLKKTNKNVFVGHLQGRIMYLLLKTALSCGVSFFVNDSSGCLGVLGLFFSCGFHLGFFWVF